MLTDILHNLVASTVVLILCLTTLWAISIKMRDASIIDIFWGAGFAIVALVCLYLSEYRSPFIWLLGVLPIIWGVRLSVYLANRNLGHGEDSRYVAMRKRSGLDEMVWRKRAFGSRVADFDCQCTDLGWDCDRLSECQNHRTVYGHSMAVD